MTPKEKKYIQIGIIATAVVIAIVLLRSKTQVSGLDEDPTGNGDVIPGQASNFDAAKVANDLWVAMNQIGTKDKDITYALRTVNQTQFGLVVEAFGARKYNQNTGNDFGWLLPEYTLAQWMREELNDDDYNLWRLKYPKYL